MDDNSTIKFICLANSFRTGGRCIGGIQLDSDNKIIVKNDRPVWIRPIGDNGQPQIPISIAQNISLLDVVEITGVCHCGCGHHSENVTYTTMKRVQAAKGNLEKYIDNSRFNLLFGNHGRAVIEDNLKDVDFSLMLIKGSECKVVEKHYEGRVNPKIYLSFKYCDYQYELPITDPFFFNKYNIDSNYLSDKDELYMVISLGGAHEGWASKLIASIIL